MSHGGAQKGGPTALARVALGAAAWGFVPIMVRAVDTEPVVIAFWRVVFGAAAFLVYFLARGRTGELLSLRGRRLAVLTFLGVLLALGWLLFFSAIVYAPVATAVLITFTAPLMLAALAPVFTGDPFDRRIIAPLLLAFVGAAVVAVPAGGADAAAQAGGRPVLGAVLAFASAVLLAVMVASQKRVLTRSSPELVLFAQTVVAAVFLAPLALFRPGPTTVREWSALAVLGLLLTTVPFLLFLSGLRRSRADRVGVVSYVEPVSAVLLAALLLGESLTVRTLLGGAAVLAGGLLAGRLQTPGPEAPVILEAPPAPSADA